RESAAPVLAHRAGEPLLRARAGNVEIGERDNAPVLAEHGGARLEIVLRLVPLAEKLVELDVVVPDRCRLVESRLASSLVDRLRRNFRHRYASVTRRD